MTELRKSLKSHMRQMTSAQAKNAEIWRQLVDAERRISRQITQPGTGCFPDCDGAVGCAAPDAGSMHRYLRIAKETTWLGAISRTWASTRGSPMRATTRSTITASSIRRWCMRPPCCFPTRRAWKAATRNTPTARAARRPPMRCASAIDALEGSAGTIMVPSGLAAVTVPLLAFLSAGDHVLITDSVYSPTRTFANTMLKRLGVEVEYYDPLIGAGIDGSDEAEHARRLHGIARLPHVRGPGHSGHRRGRQGTRRGRHDGQHLGDAALLQAARPRRRHLHPRGDEISGRPFGRAARHRVGQRRLLGAAVGDLQ